MLKEFDVTTVDCFGVQTVTIKSEQLQEIVKKLSENFDVLIDVTAVDNISSLKLVYQFLDTKSKKRLSLVTELREPHIASLTSIYQSANFLEREVYDMFGITFEGHPDLRRILLYDEFEGYPLRKSYPIDKKQPRIALRKDEERNDSLDMTRPELRYRKADFELSEYLNKKETEIDRSNEVLGGLKQTLKTHEVDDDLHSETVVVSFGPSHPATHGTIRIMAELLGEKIIDCDVEVGYLHRGFEKTAENRTYAQVLPYTDRLNYVSPLINNVGYCLTVEKLLGIEVPKRNQYIRVFMSEISRVSDHLTCLGASAMEIGAFTVMLYLMQAREYLWEIIEEITGARLTASYVRIGSLRYDLPEGIAAKVSPAFKKVRELISMADRLLSRNRIFIDRMQGIGTISKEDALSFGLTGPILRATGVNYDVRKAFPYSSYEEFDFEVPLGSNGDNYDRFMVRMAEMEQSLRIAEQAISKMPAGPIAVDDPCIVLPDKEKVYGSIEGEIQHFNMIVKGLRPPEGEIYQAVEGGNGELGFYLVSDGSNIPYRLHVRAPSFIAMGAMKKMLVGANVADIIPTFGMMNMIGGECDR